MTGAIGWKSGSRSLANIFSIAVGGFTIMDNHLHVLVRIDPERAEAWSDEEVVQRWAKLYPPRDAKRKPLPATKAWIEERLQNPEWIAQTRQRLQSLSWFMKCLKEPLAKKANRDDKVRGAFFEERFKSIAIADEQALLAVCVYIDLNPVAAGIAPVPEQSPHTSIKQRVDHVKAQGRTDELIAAPELSALASLVAGGLEDSLWLCPIEDRRGLDSSREGMFVGLPLKSYLLLVDYTGRMFRHGKARISAELAGIFERLGCPADRWSARLERLRSGRWFGRVFASTAARLQEVAAKLKVPRLMNLCGSPV